MLFTGGGLQRCHMSKRRKKCLCHWCAMAKIQRNSFRRKDEPQATMFCELIVADIAVYINCPSREGVRYVLRFTCAATKNRWSYGLQNRTGEDVLNCLRNLVEVRLRAYPGDNPIRRYHADGEHIRE